MKLCTISLVLALATLVLIAWFMFDARRLERMASSPDASLIAAPRELPEPLSLPLDATSGATNEQRIAIEPGTTEAVFSPPTSSTAQFGHIVLHGFVQPAPGTGELKGNVQFMFVRRDGRRSSASVNQDGQYEIYLVPGTWWFHVTSEKNGSTRATIEIDGSSQTQRFDLALEREVEILVKVVDFKGAPIEPVELSVIATTELPGEWFDVDDTRLDRPCVIGLFDSRWRATARVPSDYFGIVRPEREPPLYLSLLHHQRVIATQRVEANQREVKFVA